MYKCIKVFAAYPKPILMERILKSASQYVSVHTGPRMPYDWDLSLQVVRQICKLPQVNTNSGMRTTDANLDPSWTGS